MSKCADSMEKYEEHFQRLDKKDLILSRLFFKSRQCPKTGCGACCVEVSLDYFEGERWERFKKEYPECLKNFKDREYKGNLVHSDWQEGNKKFIGKAAKRCKYLNFNNGMCNIHLAHPLLCDFEGIVIRQHNKVHIRKQAKSVRFLTVNNETCSQCHYKDKYNDEELKKDISLLGELLEVSKKFNYKLKNLESIIAMLKTIGLVYPKENILFAKRGEELWQKQKGKNLHGKV